MYVNKTQLQGLHFSLHFPELFYEVPLLPTTSIF